MTSTTQQDIVVNGSITLQVSRSAVHIRYPTEYIATYNNGPYEVTATGASGKQFTGFGSADWLDVLGVVHPCIDDPARNDASCGWYRRQDGSKIQDSQGFCCRCSDLSGMKVHRGKLVSYLVPHASSTLIPKKDTPWHIRTPQNTNHSRKHVGASALE